jgi:hypothetical protein
MPRAALLFLLLAGCRPGVAHEFPAHLLLEGDARFTSAVLVDQWRVVFSFSEGSYRNVDDDPNQAAGRREYVGGRKLLALYEIADGEVRVLRRERRFGTGDGNGDDEVLGARGRAALIQRNRRTVDDILVDAGGFSLLDLYDGTLTRIYPRSELALLGLVLAATPRLVDDDGTLLYEARSKDAADEDPPRIFLRRRGGTLLDQGTGRLRGELAGIVYLERPGQPYVEALSVASGESQPLTEQDLRALEPELSSPRFQALVRVDSEGAGLLYAESASAEATRLPIEIEDLL